MFDFIITTIIPSIHVDIPTNVKKPPDICLIDIPILMLVFYGFSILSFHGFFSARILPGHLRPCRGWRAVSTIQPDQAATALGQAAGDGRGFLWGAPTETSNF